ncbi:MAG: DUF2125 domain-containing protein [Mesorhizobium sp.]|nr:DUF2125 domain-containing protein [Mesorhizobium sp.]MBN9242048.1 DUF2125 domain-containing protein [Mesorhizobium sp.]
MTSSEQSPPKARRRGLLWLVLALLVAFGLYSAGWFWLAERVRGEAARAIAALNEKGVDAECANLTVSGYPLRFAVACDGLAYEDDAHNVAATSGKLNAVATILRPFSPSAEFRGPLRTTAPGMAPLWIDWDRLTADTGLSWPRPSSLRLTAEGLSGQTDPEEGDPVSLFSAGKAETELRPNGEDLVASGRFGDVEIDADAIGGRMVPAFDAAGEATLKNGITKLQTGAKSLRGQSIEIANLELSSGEARVSLSGPLAIDADGLIDARLNIKLTNPKAIAGILSGIVPEQKRQIEQGFAALAMLGSSPSMPLVITKGKASLGFIPLGQIRAIGE